MFSKDGFTLIEAVVAMLIGAAVVVSVGTLSERLVHHRTTADSNSAAMSLAERTMEQLLALPDPTTNASLTDPGPHGPCGSPPCPVDVAGASTINGPYSLQWTVSDSGSGSSFLVTPTTEVKRLTVTVVHRTNPMVNASVVTFYNVR